MRAITVAMDLARVVTRQCEFIFKIYSFLIFPLVALLHRSLALCVKDTQSDAPSDAAMRLTEKLEHYIFQ